MPLRRTVGRRPGPPDAVRRRGLERPLPEPPSRAAATAPDGGFATVQFVVATGLSLVLFVLVANLVMAQYARAALRSAADEAAAAGSRAAVDGSALASCRARGDDALRDLLGGGLVPDRQLGCTVSADRVVATADGTVNAWLPLYPPLPVQAEAVVVREQLP